MPRLSISPPRRRTAQEPGRLMRSWAGRAKRAMTPTGRRRALKPVHGLTSGEPMLDGPSVVAAFGECGISHVIWIPDSELGTWEPALTASPELSLIRVCREGEAIA